MEKYKSYTSLSSNKSVLYTNKYSSFGDAISKYLEINNLDQTWLVEKIIRKDQKYRSLQQQVSRWLGGSPISRKYRELINSKLDINVYKDVDNNWRVSRTNERKGAQAANDEINLSLEERIEKYKSLKEKNGFSDNERDLLYEFLLNDAESLLKNLHRLVQIEKNQSD